MKKKVKNEEPKHDVEQFLDKKDKVNKMSKYFLVFIYVFFIIIVGAFCVDWYIKKNDLTFIKFDFNPEPKFGFVVDGKDKVVYFVPLSDAARDIFDTEMFKGKTRSDALAKAIAVAKDNKYLVDWEDKNITITIVSDDKDKVQDLEDKVNEDIKETDEDITSTFEEPTEEDRKDYGDVKDEEDLPDEPVAPACTVTEFAVKDLAGEGRAETTFNVAKEFTCKNGNCVNYLLVNATSGVPYNYGHSDYCCKTDYIDGYLSSSLSYSLNAPIFYMYFPSDADTIDFILKNFGRNNVFIVGGQSVLPDSASIFDGFVDFGFKMSRISGTDRFETSVNVAKEMVKIKKINSVFLVPSTEDMIDAGITSSISGRYNIPMLYSDTNQFNVSVKEYIKSNKNIKNIYVVSDLFEDSVINEVKSLGITVEVIGGETRFDTNALLLGKFKSRFDKVVVVDNPLDLMPASTLAANKDAALFYVENTLTAEQKKLINNNKDIKELYYFGEKSLSVISEEIRTSNGSKCN